MGQMVESTLEIDADLLEYARAHSIRGGNRE